MRKPDECCDIGDHGHTIPMPVNGKSVDIDFCITDIVSALNAANIITKASCCGHGKILPSIILEDGREITIKGDLK